MQFPDKMIAPFPEGTFARVDAVLRAGETRTDMVREAVALEVARREQAKEQASSGSA